MRRIPRIPLSGERHSCRTPPLDRSARHKPRILSKLAGHHAGQQSGLNLQHTAVAHTIAKERMRHQRVHPLLVGAEERLSPSGVSATVAGPDEVSASPSAC